MDHGAVALWSNFYCDAGHDLFTDDGTIELKGLQAK